MCHCSFKPPFLGLINKLRTITLTKLANNFYTLKKQFEKYFTIFN